MGELEWSAQGVSGVSASSPTCLSTKPATIAVDYEQDNTGQLWKVLYQGSTPDITRYNLANQMTSAAGNTYLYDGFNRRVKTNSNEFSAYSQDGQLLYRQDGADHIQYMYLGSRLVAKKTIRLLRWYTLIYWAVLLPKRVPAEH